jgi:hypothetical protein
LKTKEKLNIFFYVTPFAIISFHFDFKFELLSPNKTQILLAQAKLTLKQKICHTYEYFTLLFFFFSMDFIVAHLNPSHALILYLFFVLSIINFNQFDLTFPFKFTTKIIGNLLRFFLCIFHPEIRNINIVFITIESANNNLRVQLNQLHILVHQ